MTKEKKKDKECVGKKIEERFVKVVDDLEEIKEELKELKEILKENFKIKKGALEVNIGVPYPKPKFGEMLYEWDIDGAPHVNEEGKFIGHRDIKAKLISGESFTGVDEYIIIEGWTPEGERTKMVLHWPVILMFAYDYTEEEETEEHVKEFWRKWYRANEVEQYEMVKMLLEPTLKAFGVGDVGRHAIVTLVNSYLRDAVEMLRGDKNDR